MKQCAVCGGDFEPKNSKGIYCSNKCKMTAYRLKKDTPPVVQPLSPQINASVWQESVTKYCDEQGITPDDLIDTHKMFAIRIGGSRKPIADSSEAPAPSSDPTTLSRTERLKQLKAGL